MSKDLYKIKDYTDEELYEMNTKKPIQHQAVAMNDVICSDIFENYPNTKEPVVEANLTINQS